MDQPLIVLGKRKGTERVIIVVVLLVALVTLGVRWYITNNAEKESALMAELQSLRTAVQTYVLINKSFPSDLKSLAVQKFTIGNKEESYVKGVQLDKDGYPVDPFGKKFNYDSSRGWVSAAAQKYSQW